jgi:hypothetical protein
MGPESWSETPPVRHHRSPSSATLNPEESHIWKRNTSHIGPEQQSAGVQEQYICQSSTSDIEPIVAQAAIAFDIGPEQQSAGVLCFRASSPSLSAPGHAGAPEEQ